MTDATGHTFTLNGADLVAQADGCLWWPARRMLVVADLHLEKGSSQAGRGQLLPPYDTRETLARLAQVIAWRDPARVICLGDSFHDRRGAARLSHDDRARLSDLMVGRDWVWVLGNHDPAPPDGLGGDVAEDWVEGGIRFRHEARACPPARLSGGEVSGHFHPKVTISGRRGTVRGRCFARAGGRLVLPAFGAYTGGLDVFHPSIARLLDRSAQLYVLSPTRVLAVQAAAVARLARDAGRIALP